MAPTDQAMRAARAMCGYITNRDLVPYADVIDRETGLPELLQQLATVKQISFDLQKKCDDANARLAAVEALHSEAAPGSLGPLYCRACGSHRPCSTLLAARGEVGAPR